MSNDKWTLKQIEEFERHYQIVTIRLLNGESEESAFRDKPEGFSEWLKENPNRLRLPPIPSIPPYECWNCHKVYSGNKCPYCKAFKPK